MFDYEVVQIVSESVHNAGQMTVVRINVTMLLNGAEHRDP